MRLSVTPIVANRPFAGVVQSQKTTDTVKTNILEQL